MNAKQLDYIANVVADEIAKSKQESSEWKNVVRRTLAYERSMSAVLLSYFKRQERKVLSALSKHEKGIELPFLEKSFVTGESDEFSQVFYPLIKRVFGREGAMAVKVLKSKTFARLATFALGQETIDTIKGLVEIAASTVTETTFKRIVAQYDAGRELGESLAEIRARILNVFEDTIKNRVKAIVRTETMKAANAGRVEAYKQSGVVIALRFYTALDERSCDTCNSYHDNVYPIDDPDKPEIPVHPNCRCIYMPEVDPKYLKESTEDLIQKHLPGQHDQTTHGNWAYHGTTSDVAHSILKNGLTSEFRRRYSESRIFGTTDFSKAVGYAIGRTHTQRKMTPAIVVVKRSVFKPFRGSDSYSDSYLTSAVDIKPSAIKRIELYKFDDLCDWETSFNEAKRTGDKTPSYPKPYKILTQNRKSNTENNDDAYIVLLLPYTKESKSIGLENMKMGTASSGNHGHRGRPGKVGGSRREGQSIRLPRGMSPRSTLPTIEKARNALLAKLDKVGYDREYAVILTRDKIVKVRGNADSVTIPDKYVNVMTYTIHNHSEDVGFSNCDIKMFIATPSERLMEVVTPNFIFSLKKNGIADNYRRADDAYNMWGNDLNKTYYHKYDRGEGAARLAKLSLEQQQRLWSDSIDKATKKVAAKFNLTYKKISRANKKALTIESDDWQVFTDDVYILDDSAVYAPIIIGEGNMKSMGLSLLFKMGTASSGNHGHRGRPGKVGGSLPRDEEFETDTLIDVALANDKARIDALAKTTEDFQHDLFSGGANGKANKQTSQAVLYEFLRDNDAFVKLSEYMFSGDLVGHFDDEATEKATTDAEKKEARTKHMIRYLVDSWAGTSGDSNYVSTAVQLAAEAEFMVKGSFISARDGEDQNSRSAQYTISNARDLYRSNSEGLRAFVRAQYNETQHYLDAKGVKEMIVFRGVGASALHGFTAKQKKAGLNDAALRMQPLSSFSAKSDIAISFTKPTGAMIALVVPKERIFATPKTGVGCTGEHEVVILGSATTNATVISSINEHRAARLNGGVQALLTDVRVFAKKKTSTKAVSKRVRVNVDEDIWDADWTKKTWDLPRYGSNQFNQFLKISGTSLEQFQKLPVFHYLLTEKKKVAPSRSGDKAMDEAKGLSVMFKMGTAASGNYGHAGIQGHRGGSAPRTGGKRGATLDKASYAKLSATDKVKYLKTQIKQYKEQYTVKVKQKRAISRLSDKGKTKWLEMNKRIGAMEGMRRAMINKGDNKSRVEQRKYYHFAISLGESATKLKEQMRELK